MAKLMLPPAAYRAGSINVSHIITMQEGLGEYTRLRRAAQKRIKRMESAGFEKDAARKADFLQLVKPSEITSAAQLSMKLNALKHFFESPTGSVQGLKKEQSAVLQTLHEHGYDFVNASNLKDFGNFMEAARIKSGGKLQASDRIAELYGAAKRKNIPAEQLFKNFDYWQNNIKELEESKMVRGNFTADHYRRNIEQRKRRAEKRTAGNGVQRKNNIR